jgi:hypothetical protein
MSSLPNLFFRVRDNGAAVFRLDGENRDRRLDLDQIAVVNTNRGDFKPQGDVVLSPQEVSTITQWIKARKALLAEREIDNVLRAMDAMNVTAQWAQSRATDEELENVTEQLLLAIHDLRTVLVRKKADRIVSDQD